MLTHAFPAARAFALRVLTGVVLALALAAVATAPAHAIANLRKYAGIVVDAKTGKVLYQEHADDYRYPASITKVMTLYILFQELNAHHISLNTLFTVSPHAAAASPTKLGLRAGSKIRVEDIIKSIVTISANDMARVIAENISGSEDAFARRMTATAHALGMAHTTYVNASGLPDGRQLTTVRDQAILARAVYEHFPQYYHFFQTHSFKYGKRVYGNHDYVLGYMGVDGLKTGYINAAGYNLMTASREGDRHIVVIGFGFNTGGARDAMVRSLVRKYLPQARQGTYLASAIVPSPGRRDAGQVMVASRASSPVMPASSDVTTSVMPMPSPDFRGDDDAPPMPEAVAYAPEPLAYPDSGSNSASGTSAQPMDIGVRPAVAAVSAVGEPTSRHDGARTDVVGQSLNDMLLGAPPAPLGQTRASAPLIPPVGIGAQNEPIDLNTSGSIGKRQVADAAIGTPESAPAAPVGSWIVQVGAAPTQDGASHLLAAASGKVASLNDRRPYIQKFDKDGQTFYRARFIGFGDADQAGDVCSRLKKANMSCLAMQS